jgi:hypothetical protein
MNRKLSSHFFNEFVLIFSLIIIVFCAPVTGDDWEHGVVANEADEREDLAPKVPTPPEIEQVGFLSTNSYTCEL